MKKAQMIEELTRERDALYEENEELLNSLEACRTANKKLSTMTEQRDKTIERLLEDNKALVEKIKTKDKAFSELSWNYSQMINSDINPPSTELKFVQITAVPAGEEYQENEWLFGLTAEGEVFFKGANTKWEPVSMERTKDS